MRQGNLIQVLGGILISSAALSPAWLVGASGAQTGTSGSGTTTSSASDISDRIWTDAQHGRDQAIREYLGSLGGDAAGGAAVRMKDSLTSLDSSIQKREQSRSDRLTEVNKKLEEKLAAEPTCENLSEAVKLAVEYHELTQEKDRPTFMNEPRIVRLVDAAAVAAREAEGKADWFKANELFYRLNLLLEESGRFRDDVDRLGARLSMIRLYDPQQFWRLRNEERLAEGKAGLPPYNGLGEDFHEKLKDVDRSMVIRALISAAQAQIDRVPLRDSITSGIENLRTMLTTSDLKAVFPKIGEQAPMEKMLGFLDEWKARLASPDTLVTNTTLVDFTEDLLSINAISVDLPATTLLHEFGNGGMRVLDDYSAIIWPDEIARFNRMTRGEFLGVGVQIQLDEETQMIKVVTPLEGTPAMRAGIKAGDFIKKINGQSAIGISLNQAVDLITGPADTNVTVTMERVEKAAAAEGAAEGDEKRVEIDFQLTREIIPLAAVKGWRRTGPRDDQWDWFIDSDNHIGYVRLLQFTDTTTQELKHAILEMKKEGLNGLILDLRFNPGGLLTEAVSVSNLFIDDGTIVSTRGTAPAEVKKAEHGQAMLGNIPMVVLVNEGSASASEIVSGAIRHYADAGTIRALLLGKRTFGKGSVQNVFGIGANCMLKLTTQYYYLPDGRVIHRKPGASTWGVDPHMQVDMLPQQVYDALKLRQDADVLTIDESGLEVVPLTPRPDPKELLGTGPDVQLQTALFILQTQAAGQGVARLAK